MEALIEGLKIYSSEILEQSLYGEWELIYSNVELFRSSPIFLAIEEALNDEFKGDFFLIGSIPWIIRINYIFYLGL